MAGLTRRLCPHEHHGQLDPDRVRRRVRRRHRQRHPRGRRIATASADAHCAIAQPPGAAITNPLPIPGTSSVSELAAGDTHLCAFPKNAGTIVCWGRNDAGQLGPATVDGCAPAGVAVPPPTVGSSWRVATSHHELTLAARHTRAIDVKDQAWC
jgi:hypothetical protein